jgi:hypothetical protein
LKHFVTEILTKHTNDLFITPQFENGSGQVFRSPGEK